MRLFFSIPVSTDMRAKLSAVMADLAATRADVRWVPMEKLHVTVKFLAEVEEHRIPELLERMTRAALQVPAFPLEFEGPDRMPEKGPVRLIVARVHSPDQRITKLHRLIDSACGGIGLPMDTRVYVPHLTLGRVSSNHGLNRLLRLIQRHDLDFLGSQTVEEVTLCHSVSAGAEGGARRYEVLGRAALSDISGRTPPPDDNTKE